MKLMELISPMLQVVKFVQIKFRDQNSLQTLPSKGPVTVCNKRERVRFVIFSGAQIGGFKLFIIRLAASNWCYQLMAQFYGE